MRRIFCVGAGKTGTSSLHKAMEELGQAAFEVSFIFEPLESLQANSWQMLLDTIGDDREFFRGSLVRFHWKELAVAYPDAMFVLTTRKTDDWLRSQVANFAGDPKDIRTFCYGSPTPVAEYADVYEQTDNAIVHSLDETRLLVMDITAGDGWEELCPFLGLGIPDMPFPFMNKTGG